MSEEKLAEALALLDHAEQMMQEVRTGAPVGYMENDAAREDVYSKMRSANDDLENAIQTTIFDPEDPLTPEELKTFSERNAPLRRMFSYLTVEHHGGRLPQLKEAPWPPAEWVAEDNMRAEAAEAEAEPATNGYDNTAEEVPSEGPDDGADRG